jgi:hypothetical protein
MTPSEVFTGHDLVFWTFLEAEAILSSLIC